MVISQFPSDLLMLMYCQFEFPEPRCLWHEQFKSTQYRYRYNWYYVGTNVPRYQYRTNIIGIAHHLQESFLLHQTDLFLCGLKHWASHSHNFFSSTTNFFFKWQRSCEKLAYCPQMVPMTPAFISFTDGDSLYLLYCT